MNLLYLQAPAPNAIFSEVGLGTGVGATGTASAGVAGVVGLLALAAQGLLRRGTSGAVRFQRFLRFQRSDSLCSFLVRFSSSRGGTVRGREGDHVFFTEMEVSAASMSTNFNCAWCLFQASSVKRHAARP